MEQDVDPIGKRTPLRRRAILLVCTLYYAALGVCGALFALEFRRLKVPEPADSGAWCLTPGGHLLDIQVITGLVAIAGFLLSVLLILIIQKHKKIDPLLISNAVFFSGVKRTTVRRLGIALLCVLNFLLLLAVNMGMIYWDEIRPGTSAACGWWLDGIADAHWQALSVACISYGVVMPLIILLHQKVRLHR